MIETAPTTDLDEFFRIQLRPLSTSVVRVATLTQDVNASAREIAAAIGCDPVLAGRVMRAANSAYYGLDRSVTSLPAAVSTLGSGTIHSMVMAFAAKDAFSSPNGAAEERALWEHSLAVGVAGRELSKTLRMRGTEEAFLCGLLHDIGKLLMFRHSPQRFVLTQKGADANENLEREAAVYGVTHPKLSGIVARMWDFPEPLVEAIVGHHTPGTVSQSIVLARVIDAADHLANLHGHATREYIATDLCGESAIALGLSEAEMPEIWERSAQAYSTMLSFMS